MRIFFVLILFFVISSPSGASASREECLLTTAFVEQRDEIPRGLLYAIAMTESGRWDPKEGASHAWPWTIRSKKDAFVSQNKPDAINIVQKLQREGRKNIDVGCMQINLKYHPDAFSNLNQAFNPLANISYAAKFLNQLRSEGRSWQRAIEWYHSRDPKRGRDYRRKVYKHWQTAQIEINKAHRTIKQSESKMGVAEHVNWQDIAAIPTITQQNVEGKLKRLTVPAKLTANIMGLDIKRGTSTSTSNVEIANPHNPGAIQGNRKALYGVDVAKVRTEDGRLFSFLLTQQK